MRTWAPDMAARWFSITATIFLRSTDISRRSPSVPGQHVIRGQVIGYVGQSGRATGPHLHYEVRIHKVPVNPHKYLRTTYEQAVASDNSPNVASK